MRDRRRARLALAVAVVLGCAGIGARAQAPPARVVVLSTTTSTQDSGLLDVLVPMFERSTGFAVRTIAVGTGQALALALRGEADVTLAHAPAVRNGRGLTRRAALRYKEADRGRPDPGRRREAECVGGKAAPDR